jgi:hypothetical protein
MRISTAKGRARWLLAAAGLSCTLAGRARGEQPAASDEPELHFQRGVDALKTHDRATALAEFRQAEQLAPAPTTLWNIAVLELELDMHADAHRDFLTYRDELGARIARDRAEVLATTLSDLEHKLGKLRVAVSPVAASVRIDDVEVRGAVWLAPGEHVVRAEAGGHAERREIVHLDAGTSTELRMVLVPLVAPPTTAAVPRTEPQAHRAQVSSRSPLPYVLGATGIALIAAGSYFGIQAYAQKHVVDQRCGTSTICDAEGVRMNDEGRLDAMFADIGIGAGLVATGAAVYLLVSNQAPTRRNVSAQPEFRARLTVSPSGIGAVGHF